MSPSTALVSLPFPAFSAALLGHSCTLTFPRDPHSVTWGTGFMRTPHSNPTRRALGTDPVTVSTGRGDLIFSFDLW